MRKENQPQIIYSNVKEIVEHQRYVFDSFGTELYLQSKELKKLKKNIVIISSNKITFIKQGW